LAAWPSEDFTNLALLLRFVPVLEQVRPPSWFLVQGYFVVPSLGLAPVSTQVGKAEQAITGTGIMSEVVGGPTNATSCGSWG
jgi:hypothetical protein